ncbi:phage virion morphogenesis protein [Undibacterium rugosum]|uniref:phage virion morphogenesis protein n=1 Tax=Undibacterium rugosum TaxID=2762291 RepID=UPI001B82E2A3|nr:phage virion morphogenesis protein [Undibacterium rugosum]MBR7777368.1 phage virion morphogenesis protein [Undibacterium rugosum]
MSHDLTALEQWAGALLAQLEPSARSKVNQLVAQDLRRNQQQRIKAQQTPEGAAYTPRKPRKDLRGKKGRIKKQKSAMFTKLRTATHLKIKSEAGEISVGFFGRVARIARVHQFGLKDRVARNGPEVQYAERPLLGFSHADRELIKDSLLRHVDQGIKK